MIIILHFFARDKAKALLFAARNHEFPFSFSLLIWEGIPIVLRMRASIFQEPYDSTTTLVERFCTFWSPEIVQVLPESPAFRSRCFISPFEAFATLVRIALISWSLPFFQCIYLSRRGFCSRRERYHDWTDVCLILHRVRGNGRLKCQIRLL